MPKRSKRFRIAWSNIASPLRLTKTLEMHDDPKLAYRMMKEALQRHSRSKEPKLRAVYVSTVNSLAVLKAISDAGFKERRDGDYDRSISGAGALQFRNGELGAATIYQRPKAQGRLAFQALAPIPSGRNMPAAAIRNWRRTWCYGVI